MDESFALAKIKVGKQNEEAGVVSPRFKVELTTERLREIAETYGLSENELEVLPFF